MKKLLTLLLALAVLFAFTACSKPAEEAPEEPDTGVVDTENTDTENTDTENTDTENNEAASLSDTLVMENATDLTEVEGAITFTTTATMDEVKAFYTDAVATLGAEGTGADTDVAGVTTWAWSGTYDGGPLVIGATANPMGEGLMVSIAYM